MTFACVLKSGGIYGPEWVQRLRRGVELHLPGVRFVCLTDVAAVRGGVPLPLELPGWWSKLELMRPGAFVPGDRVLYLDLDSLILGSLAEIASYDGRFAGIRGFYNPEMLQSAVMAWTPSEETDELWKRFVSAPREYMQRYRGDGDFFNAYVEKPDFLPDLNPGQIVSLKLHAMERAPVDARIVCAHGRPRLSSPRSGWAHRAWMGA